MDASVTWNPEDAWVGRFNVPTPVSTSVAERTGPSVAVALIGHLPDATSMRRALEARPGSERLVKAWRKVWERAVGAVEIDARPDSASEGTTAHGLAAHYARRASERLSKALSYQSQNTEALGKDPGDRPFGWHGAEVAAHNFGDALRWAGHPGLRDFRLHAIDAADATLALAHGRPGWTALKLNQAVFVLSGVDDDGLPIIERTAGVVHAAFTEASKRETAQVASYWRSAAFQRLSGRSTWEAPDVRVAAFILAQMARDGAARAFVKARRSKVGTWTVDLSAVDGPATAAGALASAIFPLRENEPLLIQEHVPFVMEHRYFVVGGRVAASTASDRDLCALERNEDRILDERMAVIERPAGRHGLYDRGRTHSVVDRTASARCAAMARRLARGLSLEGRTDFVVDVGIADDGRCLPIELNEIGLSGPYAVDRTRICRAQARIARREEEALIRRREYLAALAVEVYPEAPVERVQALRAAGMVIVEDGMGVEFIDRSDGSTEVVPALPKQPFGLRKPRSGEDPDACRLRSALWGIGVGPRKSASTFAMQAGESHRLPQKTVEPGSDAFSFPDANAAVEDVLEFFHGLHGKDGERPLTLAHEEALLVEVDD